MCDFICANGVWTAYYAGAEFNFLKLVKYLWFWSQKKKNELNLKIVQISFDQKNRIEGEEQTKNSGKKLKLKHQKRSEEISEEHFIHRTNIALFCAYKSHKLPEFVAMMRWNEAQKMRKLRYKCVSIVGKVRSAF